MFFSRPRPTLRNRKSRSNNSSSLTKKHKFFSNERSLNSIQIRDNSIVRCNRNNRFDLRARFRHGNSFLFLFSFFFLFVPDRHLVQGKSFLRSWTGAKPSRHVFVCETKARTRRFYLRSSSKTIGPISSIEKFDCNGSGQISYQWKSRSLKYFIQRLCSINYFP